MSLDLAGPEPIITPDPALAARARSAWPLALGTCLALGSVLILTWLTPADGVTWRVLGPGLGIAAPLTALIACVLAARGGARSTKAAWTCFGIGALAILLARVLGILAHAAPPGGAASMISSTGPVLFHLAFAAGAALATRRLTTRTHGIYTLLDAGLILAVAVLLLERFFVPSVPDPALVGEYALWIGLATTPAARISLFFAALLVLRPDYRLPEFTPPFLLAAAICFLLGTVLNVDWTSAPMGLGGLATLTGWTLLALAGFTAAHASPGAPALAQRAPLVQRRIHQTLVPGAALVLGATTVDAVLWSQATLELGIASALLGLLLAARVRRTLQTDEEHAEAQRLLAQNYALVEVSRALADATDLNRTLDLVARWACQLLDASAAGVELLDTEQDELELRAIHGLPTRLLGLRTPVTGTLTGSVVRSGRALAVAAPGDGTFHFSDSAAAFGAFPTAAAPLHYRDQQLGALFAIRFDRTFDPADLELLGALADQASLAIRNAQLFQQVRALSLTDPLTGLANRRQLARDLSREFAATRRGRQLIAVLFDLDNFKEYNDQYGHPAGDEVLRLFGQALAIESRAMNLAARYGGDEFIALLADTPIEGARVFIERVASHFQEEMDRQGRGTITISAGFAECDPCMETPEELIAAADKALYRVKPGRVIREDPREG